MESIAHRSKPKEVVLPETCFVFVCVVYDQYAVAVIRICIKDQATLIKFTNIDTFVGENVELIRVAF